MEVIIMMLLGGCLLQQIWILAEIYRLEKHEKEERLKLLEEYEEKKHEKE